MPPCFNQNNFFDRDCLNINFIMARKNLPFKNQWYSHISIRYKNLWQDKCGQMRTFGCPKSCPKRRFAPKSAPRLQPSIWVVKLERAIVTFLSWDVTERCHVAFYPLVSLPRRPVPVISLQFLQKSPGGEDALSVRLDIYCVPASSLDFV